METESYFLEVRCPQCMKLYKVNTSDIHSRDPRFECIACKANFTFSYSPQRPQQVIARTTKMPQVAGLAKSKLKADAQKMPPAELRACPKCKSLNPRTSQDCYSCGVVFEKYEMMLAEGGSDSVFPSLVKAWKSLMKDYGYMAKHVAFVDTCEELQALPFAMKKYKDLKEIQPQDNVAKEMLNSVVMRAATGANSIALKTGLNKVNWDRVAKLSPVVMGSFFLLCGIFRVGSPNMAGVGVALLVLTAGLTVFFKGRLHWKDFWH